MAPPRPLPRPFALRERVIRPSADRVAIRGRVAEDARLHRPLSCMPEQSDEDDAFGGVVAVDLDPPPSGARSGRGVAVGDVGEEVLKAGVGHRAPSRRGRARRYGAFTGSSPAYDAERMRTSTQRSANRAATSSGPALSTAAGSSRPSRTVRLLPYPSGPGSENARTSRRPTSATQYSGTPAAA